MFGGLIMILFEYRKPLNGLVVANVNTIDTLYLHHTGNDNNILENTDYQMDLSPEKFAWLAYGMYYVDGKEYWVRGYENINAGVKHHNGHGVSLVIQGNYDYKPPEEYDLINLEKRILQLKRDLPNLKYIKGHNEDFPTECPGHFFPMERFRKLLRTDETLDERFLTKKEFRIFLDGYKLQKKRMYRYINK